MQHIRTALLLTVLVPGGGPIAGEPAADLRTLREDARAAMKPCGHCHDATQPRAMGSALAAFDLDQVEWASALTLSKLECMDKRAADLKVPEAGRGRVRTYLDAEWKHRAALSPEVRNRERAP